MMAVLPAALLYWLLTSFDHHEEYERQLRVFGGRRTLLV